MARAKIILAGLKRAGKALLSPAGAAEPTSYRAGGKVITCSHCGGSQFLLKRASLNHPFSSLTGSERLDREAHVLICSRCSEMRWFYDEPEEDA